MKNKAGTLKAQLSGEARYYSFVPTALQEIALGDLGSEFNTFLGETRHFLGVLDTLASKIPHIDLFLAMYVRKEALMSSQIEGTQATLDDILNPHAEENQNMNVGEVINYIQAVHFSYKRLEKLPLCMRLLRETHKVLLSGQRGSDKNPGEFRRSQNWIGDTGSTIKNARFIPPSPGDMAAALDDLEKFLNDGGNTGSNVLDPLIRAALVHYQFETIHPFLDGNGRIGRLLILLYLHEQKILTKPALYISYFLKLNRVEYYDRLSFVRQKGDYNQWVKFFVKAVHAAAKDAVKTIDVLTKLREKNLAKIAGLGRSAKNAQNLYHYLEHSPIIDIGKTSKELRLSFNTTARAVGLLVDLRILKATSEGRRNRCFAYEAYLAVLRKGT
jgi:Fic family protein